ncbi:Peroxyureidoacrylate/ureidoacrylate amidohydrolase RutB [Arcobacter porcinus]|uniref:Peroxyureidoacrylate/ureidoacrylate amidohydrolase RutB n=2 Tax=Arcobacter porcinus TaxID=1935204 RepID=A0ABX2YBH8_9BACT|nr:Peroxyureidoacrylate/ureidoacrylate amidohydrolase RutB [Arcobacter porcinus]OCL89272.1 Peroxyureidoacrylate/ureidoacrylate amidohydrolase RutB [Arcobacter porcinus]OCL91692.1 Peroxyureidoacrylate/ureidoacrylate amidohydrolase RutB [Arcobacter porcinus]
MTKNLLLALFLVINLYSKENEMQIIDPKDSALLLIEYQNEWLDENSKLYNLMKDKKQFEESIKNSKEALEFARKIGMNVVHIPLILSDDYKEFGNGQYGLRAVIPQVKTWQGKSKNFHKDFIPKENEFVVSGRLGASGFAGSNLDSILRNNGIKTLYMTGFATNVCVESTFREAHDKGYNSIVIDDATSSFTKEEKEFFIKNIVHHFGANISTKNFINSKISKDKKELVSSFYKALGQRDINKALSLVDENIQYLAVKETSPTFPELYGKYSNKKELLEFFIHLNEYYKTLDFRIESIGENENNIFVKGYLKYEILKNKEIYETDFMASILIENGLIKKYKFFKDTALLEYLYEKE